MEKLYIKVDAEGYITAVAQEPYDGYIKTEITIEQFIKGYTGINITDGRHKYFNGKIIYDNGTAQSLMRYNETVKNELREERARVCFPIVNRGQVWYNNLTEQQRMEIFTWYNAWLNITETLKIPVMPNWLK